MVGYYILLMITALVVEVLVMAVSFLKDEVFGDKKKHTDDDEDDDEEEWNRLGYKTVYK